jgi:hypothetical protein
MDICSPLRMDVEITSNVSTSRKVMLGDSARVGGPPRDLAAPAEDGPLPAAKGRENMNLEELLPSR